MSEPLMLYGITHGACNPVCDPAHQNGDEEVRVTIGRGDQRMFVQVIVHDGMTIGEVMKRLISGIAHADEKLSSNAKDVRPEPAL